jgi:hypothetical protein
MIITEYANLRGVQVQTVSKYIRRHPEISEHLILNADGTKELDPEAVRLLDKKYPPIQREQVVSLAKYNELLETVNKQSFQIINLQQQLEAERERTWWDKLWHR